MIPPGYRDSGAPTEERVRDLLERMTLDEKIAQLGSCWSFELLTSMALDPAKAAQKMGHGIGQITRIAGATNLGQRAAAELARLRVGIRSWSGR